MYKSQGIDLSDSQIDAMRKMVSPEMMKAAVSIDPSQLSQRAQQPSVQTLPLNSSPEVI